MNMSTDDLKVLQKEVRKAKRIASEKGAMLHDLVEDSLPAGYAALPALAQATFEACKAWDEANQRLIEAQGNENE